MSGFLEDALKKHLAPLLERFWQSATFWRTIALLALVLLAAAWTFREHLRAILLRSKRIEHDSGLFDRSDAIMPEEALSNCLTSLWNANEYRHEHRDKLAAFVQFFDQSGNQYLAYRLSRVLKPLTNALNDLLDFTYKHFFVHPNPGGDRSCLYPEYRNPLDAGKAAIYQRHAEELATKVKCVEEAYRRYRIVIGVPPTNWTHSVQI